MHFIEELETPIERPSGFADQTITLTHACYGFTFQPWNTPELNVYRVLGRVVDGRFHYFAGTDEVFPVERSDFDELLAPNEAGKPHGGFNVRDIIAAFKAVKARIAAPPKVD